MGCSQGGEKCLKQFSGRVHAPLNTAECHTYIDWAKYMGMQRGGNAKLIPCFATATLTCSCCSSHLLIGSPPPGSMLTCMPPYTSADL